MRVIAGMIFRKHRCESCNHEAVSVQLMLDPATILESGISPLISSEQTRRRAA